MKKEKVIPIIGALVIGALGSGLWELVKPLLSLLGAASLNIVTLGLDSLRDGLYSEAATMQPERAALAILSSLQGVLLAIPFILYMRVKSWKGKPDTPDPPLNASREELIAFKEMLEERLKNLENKAYIAIVGLALILSVNVLMFQRLSYISKVSAHFDQLVSMAAPYIDGKDVLLIRSQYARIKSKSDYEAIVLKLSEILKKNDISPPQFRTF